jgi:hypothetical protein
MSPAPTSTNADGSGVGVGLGVLVGLGVGEAVRREGVDASPLAIGDGDPSAAVPELPEVDGEGRPVPQLSRAAARTTAKAAATRTASARKRGGRREGGVISPAWMGSAA